MPAFQDYFIHRVRIVSKTSPLPPGSFLCGPPDPSHPGSLLQENTGWPTPPSLPRLSDLCGPMTRPTRDLSPRRTQTSQDLRGPMTHPPWDLSLRRTQTYYHDLCGHLTRPHRDVSPWRTQTTQQWGPQTLPRFIWPQPWEVSTRRTTDSPIPKAFRAALLDPSLPRKSDVHTKNIQEHMLGKLSAHPDGPKLPTPLPQESFVLCGGGRHTKALSWTPRC